MRSSVGFSHKPHTDLSRPTFRFWIRINLVLQHLLQASIPNTPYTKISRPTSLIKFLTIAFPDRRLKNVPQKSKDAPPSNPAPPPQATPPQATPTPSPSTRSIHLPKQIPIKILHSLMPTHRRLIVHVPQIKIESIVSSRSPIPN